MQNFYDGTRMDTETISTVLDLNKVSKTTPTNYGYGFNLWKFRFTKIVCGAVKKYD